MTDVQIIRQAIFYTVFQATIIFKQGFQLDAKLQIIMLVINILLFIVNITFTVVFLVIKKKYQTQATIIFIMIFPLTQILCLLETDINKSDEQQLLNSLLMIIFLITLVSHFEKDIIFSLSSGLQNFFLLSILVRYTYLGVRVYLLSNIRRNPLDITILTLQLLIITMMYCFFVQVSNQETQTVMSPQFTDRINQNILPAYLMPESPKVETRPKEFSTKKGLDEAFSKRFSADNYIATKSPSQKELLFLKIVEQFPQGVAIIKFSQAQNPTLVFTNNSMLSLFKIQDKSRLIEEICQLKDLQIVNSEFQSQQGDQVSQITPFKSFLFENLPGKANTYSKQANINPLHNYSRRKSDRKHTYRVTNIFQQELLNIHLLLQKAEVKNSLKYLNKVFELHCILNGYKNYEPQNQRCIEIKLLMSNLNEDPQVLILARDVSHREYINILNKNNKAKSNQLTHVSHEFRTPLGCIITMLEACEADEIQCSDQKNSNLTKNKRLKYLRSGLQNSKYLLNLSNDLLDLAQIKVGKFKLNKRNFNLKEVLLGCIDMFSISADKKKIELNLTYTLDLPSNIYQDENRLKQVIINIIGNAFKFTLHGSISISVQWKDIDSIWIYVQDTGIGIKEEDKQNLFSAFGKINSDETKKLNRQGVGLGLLISNMITKNLNKELIGLQFNSQYNQGTTFYFQMDINPMDDDDFINEIQENQDIWRKSTHKIILEKSKSHDKLINYSTDVRNLDKPESEINAQEASTFIQRVYDSQITNKRFPSNKQCECAQVLIIDDNHFNIEALQCLFLSLRNISKINYTISGELAIKDLIQRFQNKCCPTYKIILLDLEMPGMDGYETFGRLKCLSVQNKLPLTVFACSGHSYAEEREKCVNVGMNGYLEKPIVKIHLTNLIDEYLL